MGDPTLVYDDDCGFCTWWAELFAARSEFRVVGFSELTAEQRGRLPDDYEECSHLLVDGEIYSCGASIEQAFVRSDLGEPLRPAVRFLRNFADYEQLREMGYRTVADNRDLFGALVSSEPPARRSDGSD